MMLAGIVGAHSDCSANPSPTGNIYVTNRDTITVYAANPSRRLNEAPLAMIAGSNTGLHDPNGIAVDASGKIYVTNWNRDSHKNSITVYAANQSGTLNEAPLATIAGSNTGLNFINDVAVDASGKIYVTNQDISGDSITVYAANPSGTLNEAPLATITGSNTRLNFVTDVAVDASGKIYVTNNNVNSGSITVYAANPSGTLNEAPLATITGSSTELSPISVAVDASGTIYVTNCNYIGSEIGSITVYAANPSGTLNEAPLATITGSSTGFSEFPGDLAVDASGRIYVANVVEDRIAVFAANPIGTLNEAPLAMIYGGHTELRVTGGIAVH